MKKIMFLLLTVPLAFVFVYCGSGTNTGGGGTTGGGTTTAHRAYVSNFTDNTISVIDTVTDNVVKTIQLNHPGGVVAVLPAINRLYVTAVVTPQLTVIDTLTDQILTTINLPGRTGSVETDPTTKKVYVAEHGDSGNPPLLPLGTHVWVLDGSSYLLTKSLTLGTNLQDLAVDSVNRRFFLTDFGLGAPSNGLVFPIDSDTDNVLTAIQCGTLPHGVAVHQSRRRAYVTNKADNSVTVIDTNTGGIVTTITVGHDPEAIDVDEAADRAIVTNTNDNTVTLLDTSSNLVIAPSPISVGTRPVWVAVDSSMHKAYVVNAGSSNISVINTQTGSVITTIPVGSDPVRIKIIN